MTAWTFGSGWYERGPAKHDAPAYTWAFVGRAIGLYNAIGREDTVGYYNTKESVDGQWYVFIVDEDGYTIGHHNPMFRSRDPSLRVDSTGYFYGEDLLSATESGRWVDYVLLNPETGDEQEKHTWAVAPRRADLRVGVVRIEAAAFSAGGPKEAARTLV